MKSASNLLANYMVGNRFACVKAAGGAFTRSGVLRRPSFITVAGWVNIPVALYNDADILQTDWAVNGWNMKVNAAGVASFNVAKASSIVSSGQSAGGAITTKAWNRLVGTYDNDKARIYINGVLAGTGASVAAAAITTSSDLTQDAGDVLNFKDLAVWSRPLSAAEILADYKGSVIQQGLVGRWPCDDGTGLTLGDVSGGLRDIAVPANYTFTPFNPYPGDSHKLSMADLYTFNLKDGTQLRYTGYDRPITVGAANFTHNNVRINRTNIKMVVGIEVDVMTLTAFADTTHLVNGVPFLHACHLGNMDGASVKLERAFLVPGTSLVVGSLVMFSGIVGNVQITKTSATMTVNSDLILLNTPLPRNVYQPGCIWTLFDTGCVLNKNNFRDSPTVAAGSTILKVRTNSVRPTGYFDLGQLQFTSGALSGVIRAVKSYNSVNGEFTLARPLASVPQAGDGMFAWPGCDKTQATCTNKFNNVIHFRGYPYVPAPETAI